VLRQGDRLLVLGDEYTIREDKGLTQTEALPQVLQSGFQGAWLYSYESVRPRASGDLEWGFSMLDRRYRDAYRDTIRPYINNEEARFDERRWYPMDGVSDKFFRLGQGNRRDRQVILSGMWSPYEPFLGAMPSYGIEVEYTGESRRFIDHSTNYDDNGNPGLNVHGGPAAEREIERDMTLVNALYRLRWNLGPGGHAIETSAGAAWAQDAPRNGEDAESVPILPMASLRYTHPVHEDHTLFAEVAGRHSAVIEPSGYNQLGIKVTPSVEGKLGGNGFLGEPVRYAWSGYTRWYDNPSLPVPDVFWNYAEIREASHAVVQGANLTLTYLPGHHVGVGMNASIIQGQYSMRDGGTLPWESNRTLDLVSNVRFLPRDDSLFSFILTYGIHNDAPLYEYHGLWNPDEGTQGVSTGQRAVYQSSNFPTVSRQRLDLRVNIDLKSDWRPLESMRFFFEAHNLFADYDEGWASLLGGRNERRRGWTRDTEDGELFPVVTRGLGLFLMFGIEGKLKI
jgi:hypothetical protein